MSFKFGLNVKHQIATTKVPKKIASGRTKPLLGEDEDKIQSEDDGNIANSVQEIGEFTSEDGARVSWEVPKHASGRLKKGQRPTPPLGKIKAKDGDPTALSASVRNGGSNSTPRDALNIDAAIYDYDSAYDALHAKSAEQAAAERENAEQRRPKYMNSLLASAEQRKKDMLRAKDKLLQREREAEGDEFADKEKFVTGAYKAQQEESQKAEEEERKRQEAEDERRKRFGMQSFHKQMLLEQGKRHQELQEATERALREGVKLVTGTPQEKTDFQIAEEMRKQGREITLNEEGQIADKRQLLDAGLNIIAKARPASTSSVPPHSSAPQTLYLNPRGSRNAQRARQTQMVAEQIEQAAKRKADDEAEEQAKLASASKSQKTSLEISSAKERYLKRKREAAEAKARLNT